MSFATGFQDLVARLDATGRDGRVICVASDGPEDGDVEAARLLALTHAEGGARRPTLLIDVDVARDAHFPWFNGEIARRGLPLAPLQDGRLHGQCFFRTVDASGASAARGEEALVMRRTGIGRLFVAHARPGPLAGLTVQLSAAPAFWAAARQTTALTVAHLPWLSRSKAGFAVAAAADGVLLVGSMRRGRVDRCRAAIERMRERGARVLGFIATDADPLLTRLEGGFG